MCTGTPRKTGVCGRGLDPGEAVSRETGICLKMTHSTSCVCSGDAANHRRASDLWANVCQHYTSTQHLPLRAGTNLHASSPCFQLGPSPHNKMPYCRDAAADGSPR